MRSLPVLFVALSLAAVAGAQSPAEALRAEPKTYALKDIPDDYRGVTIGSGDLSPWLLFGMASGGSNSRPSERLLFRALSAAWVQPDEFADLLDGKRPRIRGFRIDVASLAGPGSEMIPVFTETWLEAGRIITWSPAPDLSKASLTRAFAEAMAGGEGNAVPTASAEATSAPPVPVNANERMSSVKQVALAVHMYAADNEDRFPRATASAQLQPLVLPYVKNSAVFAPSPEGGRLLYNTYLTGVRMTAIENIAETILLWEERAWPDNRRAVAFADGHVKRVDEATWSKLWKDELKRRAEAKAQNERELRRLRAPGATRPR